MGTETSRTLCAHTPNKQIVSDSSVDSRGYLCLDQSIETVTGAYMTNVKVNGRELRFKIDTGADVTRESVNATFSNAKLQTATW